MNDALVHGFASRARQAIPYMAALGLVGGVAGGHQLYKEHKAKSRVKDRPLVEEWLKEDTKRRKERFTQGLNDPASFRGRVDKMLMGMRKLTPDEYFEKGKYLGSLGIDAGRDYDEVNKNVRKTFGVGIPKDRWDDLTGQGDHTDNIGTLIDEQLYPELN